MCLTLDPSPIPRGGVGATPLGPPVHLEHRPKKCPLGNHDLGTGDHDGQNQADFLPGHHDHGAFISGTPD